MAKKAQRFTKKAKVVKAPLPVKKVVKSRTPKSRRSIKTAVFEGVNTVALETAVDNTQKVLITAAPDGIINGALVVSVVSGDGSFTQDPASPLSFFAVSGATGGGAVTAFAVHADNGTTAGLDDSVNLTVSDAPAPPATTLGLSAGTPEPK